MVPRLAAAHTLAMGISVDSVYSHANWACKLGGVSLPLLADFHPKGAVAESLGVYLDGKGITDRATVVIDAAGVVRYAESVTPAGARDMEQVAALCEDIDKAYAAGAEPALPAFGPEPGLPDSCTLFVKGDCGASEWALLAVENLHLHDRIAVRNIEDGAEVLEALKASTGEERVPALTTPAGPAGTLHDVEIGPHLARLMRPNLA